MQKTKPIQILGGGPAGLSAAIVLAKAGREVHIHERYDKIGKRFQGDLQGLENWSSDDNVLSVLQSFGIDINFQATPFTQMTLTDGKRAFDRTSETPFFYLVKRGPFAGSLDMGLEQQAVKLGVKIHYRSSLNPDSAHIVATGPIRKALIAADKGIGFSTTLPNTAVAFFHDRYAYLGYSYFLVSEGYGCICTVVFKEFNRLNECFERTVDAVKKMFSLDLSAAHSVGGIGSYILNHQTKQNDSLLVGEAGGFQDLLWGFGIRTALTSGYHAAQSILYRDDYALTIKKTLEPSLKASLVNRFLWEKIKTKSRPLLPYLLLPRSLHRNLSLLYRYSFLHRILFPFAKRYIKKHYPQSIE